MKIFIGSDHRGFALKNALLSHFSKTAHILRDAAKSCSSGRAGTSFLSAHCSIEQRTGSEEDQRSASKDMSDKINWVDCGCFTTERTDYPIYAASVCDGVLQNPTINRGILICGSGVGMSIAANRHKKIYAALCWNEAITMSARADDNANILVLPASEIDVAAATKLVEIFLTTPFKDGAYAQRLCMID